MILGIALRGRLQDVVAGDLDTGISCLPHHLDERAAGPGGALYAEEFFTEARGDVTAYVPVGERAPLRTSTMIAGGRFAVALHPGALTNFDTTYAALGSYVAEHSRTRPGPIREIYLVSPPESIDEASLRTEVCWPIQEGSIR